MWTLGSLHVSPPGWISPIQTLVCVPWDGLDCPSHHSCPLIVKMDSCSLWLIRNKLRLTLHGWMNKKINTERKNSWPAEMWMCSVITWIYGISRVTNALNLELYQILALGFFKNIFKILRCFILRGKHINNQQSAYLCSGIKKELQITCCLHNIHSTHCPLWWRYGTAENRCSVGEIFWFG